jgi:hypothetical protein
MTPETDACVMPHREPWGRGNLHGAGHHPARVVKEMSGRPTSRSIRTTKTNAGSPTGREPYGDGVPIVVVGVTSHQGDRESRSQGEGAQVIATSSEERYAQCRSPQRCWMSPGSAVIHRVGGRSLESSVTGNCHAEFGKRLTEKGLGYLAGCRLHSMRGDPGRPC